MFSGNGDWICLPAIGNARGAAGSAGESMAIPVASSSPHENPQTEPSGVRSAGRRGRVPVFAQIRTRPFFCPNRASSV